MNFSYSKPIATPNFGKYLSKILDIFLFTKNCSVYAFRQFFDCHDVTHFGPERNKAEDSQLSQPKTYLRFTVCRTGLYILIIIIYTKLLPEIAQA